MSKETTDTLGNQKKTNYALQKQSRAAFIKKLTEDILPAPQYFSKNALMNKKGYENIDEVMHRGLQALSAGEFENMANQYRALLLDTRNAKTFSTGFIPNSINIGLDGQFAPWVGALIMDIKQPILLITDPGKEEETVTRLTRVGYDNTLGYLSGGFQTWRDSGKEIDSISTISAEKFAALYSKELYNIDVRKESEYETAHLSFSQNKPLDYINDWATKLDKQKTYYINCAGGYRSMITSSILKSRGFENIINVEGGFGALAATDLPINKQAIIKP